MAVIMGVIMMNKNNAAGEHANAVNRRSIEKKEPAKVCFKPDLYGSDHGDHSEQAPHAENNTRNAGQQFDRDR